MIKAFLEFLKRLFSSPKRDDPKFHYNTYEQSSSPKRDDPK